MIAAIKPAFSRNHKQRWWYKAIVGVLLYALSVPAYAAEVYYLGNQNGEGGQPFPAYSLTQRAQDLFDSAVDVQDEKDRSGKIGGRFMSEFSAQDVSGNKEKSFYERGADHVEEMNLYLMEKLMRDYQLDAELFMRKTDAARIEPRRDVRIEQLNVRVSNPQNSVEFGDVYADFSQFVMGASLEGFSADIGSLPHQRYKAVVARTTRADVVSEQYQRNVFGGKADFSYFEDSEIFSLFRHGVQVATIQDDSSTAPETASSADLANTVGSIDGEINFVKWATFQYEVARSAYLADDDSTTGKDPEFGTALRLLPGLNFFDGKLGLRYLYYYVDPEFYTETGSAAPDKIQHQWTMDLRLTERATLSLVENLYWDHLEGSERDKRTIYDEKYMSVNIRPFETRDMFSIRPYINYQRRTSDDPTHSALADTTTPGIAINDTVCGTSVGTFYEYRAYDDKASPGSSDYFNRFGLNASRDFYICGRRLYASAGYSTDIRNTKLDNDKDTTSGLSFTGEYDLLDVVALRGGYNIQNSNNSQPDGDYRNFQHYAEIDWTALPLYALHLVLRGEYNRYDHEDGTQDYNESRVVAKMLTNF